MDKKQVKTLEHGDPLLMNSDRPVVVVFAKIGYKGNPVVSFPNMGGTSVVPYGNVQVVSIDDLSGKQLRDYETALQGLERYAPEE